MKRTWRRALAVLIGSVPVFPALAVQTPAVPWVPPAVMSDPAPSGRRIADAGLIGNYYPAAGPGRHAAILVLGGSEGALGQGPTVIARALQAEGYAVLHISYFRAPGQSPTLQLVPLETFDRALAWLKARPEVDDRRLAVVGASKGAEAALLVGSRHPDLKAVVAGMPSSVVWPGIDWAGATPDPQSSWSVGGEPLPDLPYGAPRPGGSLSEIYTSGLAALPTHRAARIPVERGRFPILLVCGRADSLWPSCPMADQVKAAAARRISVLSYPDAGHGVFGPPVSGDPARLATLGGSGEGNQRARQDGWPRVLAFLRKALA